MSPPSGLDGEPEGSGSLTTEREMELHVAEVVRSVVGSGSRLDRAVVASRLAKAADRVSRVEVMAARDAGATWAEVAEAFGISTQAAHERFRSGPDGLHSRRSQVARSVEE